MKEHQLLIGLGLIALAIFFGLQNATLTEYDACMKHAHKDSVMKISLIMPIIAGPWLEDKNKNSSLFLLTI